MPIEQKRFGFFIVERCNMAYAVVDAGNLADAVKDARKVARHDHIIIKMRDGRGLLLSEEDRKESVHSPQKFMQRMAELYGGKPHTTKHSEMFGRKEKRSSGGA